MELKKILALMVCVTAFQLHADEERVEVGSRALSPSEYEHVSAITKENRSNETELEPKPVYVTSHPGAFHRPKFVSYYGDTLELEDGSVWEVAPSDRWMVLNWFGEDLFIMVNHDWFSFYDYRIVNLSTGDQVRVNMNLGPFYQGPYTHWVVGFNDSANELVLEDGSIWKISWTDAEAMKYWKLNDTVMIGVYDGWLSGSNPNFLINVNMNKRGKPSYLIGRCLFY